MSQLKKKNNAMGQKQHIGGLDLAPGLLFCIICFTHSPPKHLLLPRRRWAGSRHQCPTPHTYSLCSSFAYLFIYGSKHSDHCASLWKSPFRWVSPFPFFILLNNVFSPFSAQLSSISGTVVIPRSHEKLPSSSPALQTPALKPKNGS